MTICIAASVNNDRVIVIADKMVSVNLPNIKYERRASKIIKLNSSCVLATAGDALIHAEILRRVGKFDDTALVSDIADRLKEAYAQERERIVEEVILRPVGLSLDMVKNQQPKMRSEIVMNAMQQMAQFRFEFVMLVAGVDSSGAHIFTIVHPGHLRCMDSLRYWAIGSGEHHALQTFITSDYDEPISVNRALLVTYEAKKRAEKATGVGTMTDMIVVKKGTIVELNQTDIAELERVYKEKVTSESEWLQKFDKTELKIKI